MAACGLQHHNTARANTSATTTGDLGTPADGKFTDVWDRSPGSDTAMALIGTAYFRMPVRDTSAQWQGQVKASGAQPRNPRFETPRSVGLRAALDAVQCPHLRYSTHCRSSGKRGLA